MCVGEQNFFGGEPSKKKMSQIVEKVHKGGGGQRQNQNSLHFKCRLTLTEEGGGRNFSDFPQIKRTEI